MKLFTTVLITKNNFDTVVKVGCLCAENKSEAIGLAIEQAMLRTPIDKVEAFEIPRSTLEFVLNSE